MDVLRELTVEELSAMCSSLAKACAKQLLAEEADLFGRLAEYYKSKSTPDGTKRLDDLAVLIQRDLNTGFPEATKIAIEEKDRGALRALTWGEKVTTILKSLLDRYDKQQNSLLENTEVYVCEICGFIFVGDEPPAICPICKVPNFKLNKVKRSQVLKGQAQNGQVQKESVQKGGA